jgi:hypothetical protein
VVQDHDFGEHSGQVFVALELVDGLSLAALSDDPGERRRAWWPRVGAGGVALLAPRRAGRWCVFWYIITVILSVRGHHRAEVQLRQVAVLRRSRS